MRSVKDIGKHNTIDPFWFSHLTVPPPERDGGARFEVAVLYQEFVVRIDSETEHTVNPSICSRVPTPKDD